MISIGDFMKMLNLEQGIIKLQTEGLTTADTLVQPQPSGNCMNWVLGHTLDSQIIMLKLMGEKSPIPEEELALYTRNSEPITGESTGVLSLEQLLAYHARVNDVLLSCLEQMDEADFEQKVESEGRTGTLAWMVFFRQFHYTYHLGQLELLRQLAGKMEKLI